MSSDRRRRLVTKHYDPFRGMSMREWFWSGYSSSASVVFLRQPVRDLKEQEQEEPKWLRERKAKRAATRTYRKDRNEWERSAPLAWQDEAACAGTNLYAFTPPSQKDYTKNQAWRPFCDGCPVAKQCLQFGRESDSQGLWGGVYLDGRGGEYDVETNQKLQS